MSTAASTKNALDPELTAIRQELEQVTVSVRKLVESCDDKSWAWKPSAKRWSAAECVIHLNKTSEMALPLLRKAADKAKAQNRHSEGPYRLDPIGRFILRFTEPPYRMKAPSPASYIPNGVVPRADVLREFEELQRQMIELVESVDGLALCEIKISWPVFVPIKYNMFASLKVFPAHQRRHLWQAEQVARRLLVNSSL
jgi:hypothetical protein